MDNLKPLRQTRDPIEDVFGPRTPYKHEWPTRQDEFMIEEPTTWKQSACVLCSNGCGLDIGVKDGKVVGVRGRITDRVNKGRLGPKGLLGYVNRHLEYEDYSSPQVRDFDITKFMVALIKDSCDTRWQSMNHPDRLKYPMIRRNGKLERASWDDAMSLVVRKAKETREKLTSHGIGFYTSGQLFLEEYYALALIGKAGLNTLHMDGNTRLCTATAAASMRESFGSDGQPGSYEDIDFTDCILMVGHNMAATQTVLFSRILDRLEGHQPPDLIVIDPRRSESARHATVHLAPKIGTNLALLNGIQYLLFENSWVNWEYVQNHVVGLEKLRETVQEYTPQRVAQITGVSVEQIIEAARIIGNAPSLLSTCLQGVYQSNQATASACAVNNINLLRGMYGKPGCGVFQMNGQPTAQNNREAGCDGEFPGFRNSSNPNQMQELADLWNIDLAFVPHWNQPTHIENMLTYMAAGSIEMLYISGTNPLVSLPNLPRVREILTKPEVFVVVQDIFPTETTDIADVVLPAAQWGEKTGCFTNVDRTVHLSHKAVDPPGEARSDLDIFLDFSSRMDFRDKDGKPLIPWSTPEEGFEAFKGMTKGRPCDYSELTYAKLTGGSGIQWPCTNEFPYGQERLFTDGKFFTDVEYCESFGHDLETGTPMTKDEYKAMAPNGRAILKACHYIEQQEKTSKDYPIQLSTGRNRYQFHTRTKTGRVKQLQNAAPAPQIKISESDARNMGVADGDQVLVTSRRGEVQLSASVGNIAVGQAFIPFHFGYWDQEAESRARAANELTQENWDPISKQPQFKGGAVRIERVEDQNQIVARQQHHNAAIEKASSQKPDAAVSDDSRPRQQLLRFWLGAAAQSIRLFSQACEHTIPTFVQDMEVVAGVKTVKRIADNAIETLEPVMKKYEADESYGQKSLNPIVQTVLSWERQALEGPYGTMVALQGLQVYLSNAKAHLTVLMPVSQALWDENFTERLSRASSAVDRCSAWVNHQLAVRAPQTLVVPMKEN